MFTASDEKLLISFYEQAINICKDSNSYVMIIIKLMEKKNHLAPYLIDQDTFGLRGSSYSEFNHSSLNFLLLIT